MVAENGKVLTVDEAAIKAEIRERTAALHRDLAATASGRRKLEPYYAQMYRRAASTDIGFGRWPA